MKAVAATSLLATAGLAALSTSGASAATVPASFDRRGGSVAGSSQPLDPVVQMLAKRDPGAPITLPLQRRKQSKKTPEEVHAFAKSQIAYVKGKFGSKKVKRQEMERRQLTGLVDLGPDVQYYAQLSVGTPAQNFNIILDTGSADFWVALDTCTDSQCAGIEVYEPSKSSTSISSTTAFEIEYGSGAVEGVLYADTTDLAGYTIYNLTVAGITELASGTITNPTSGILGLGFQQLATSGATPFVEVLYKSGVLTDPAFTFQLTTNEDSTSTEATPGGVFTIGEIQTSQYSGDITYTDLPDTTVGQEGYWAIPLDSMTVQGTTIDTDSGVAAIDTGTTLIGGPSSVVEEIYAAISGSEAVTESGESSSTGYYAYPCSTSVTVSATFGGKAWTISSTDFNGGSLGTSGGVEYCLGAIFVTDLGDDAPTWVFGDTFLKNVFSVFEFNPERVGFASLVNGAAQTASTTVGAVASGTAADSSATSSNVARAVVATTTPAVVEDAEDATTSDTSIVGGSGLPAPSAASTISSTGGTSLTSDSSSSSTSTSASASASSVTTTVSSTASTSISTGTLVYTSSIRTVSATSTSTSSQAVATSASSTKTSGAAADLAKASYASKAAMALAAGVVAALLL